MGLDEKSLKNTELCDTVIPRGEKDDESFTTTNTLKHLKNCHNDNEDFLQKTGKKKDIERETGCSSVSTNSSTPR